MRDLGGPDNWGQVVKLTASDAAVLDSFVSVSLCGDTVIIGALADDDADNDSGSAYIFQSGFGGHTPELRGRADFLRKKTRTGRPCGDMAYVRQIKSRIGRDLTARKPAPRSKNPTNCRDKVRVPRIIPE